MKAIHNSTENRQKNNSTVFNTSNIQNESNSQQTSSKSLSTHNCVQYVKYTK